MPATYKDGKLVSNTSAAPSKSSKSKSSAQATTTTGGSGGKGGGKPDIASNKVSSNPYNTDKSYGYYNEQGKYVSALQDMFDGGGKNQSGNYFEGAGAISSMLNAAKVRPAGAARERDAQGNYVVDRADIGYRDFKDMYDRGGPQASGGRFEGLGLYSDFANLLFGEKGQRTPYANQTAAVAQAVKDLQNPVKWGVNPVGPSAQPTPNAVDPRGFAPNTQPTPPTSLLSYPLMAQAKKEAAMGLGPFGWSGSPDMYNVGAGGEYAGMTPIPQQQNVTMSVLDQPQNMVYEIDNYLRSINEAVTPQNRMKFMPAFRQQFGL